MILEISSGVVGRVTAAGMTGMAVLYNLTEDVA
jgi:hypothetical protein